MSREVELLLDMIMYTGLMIIALKATSSKHLNMKKSSDKEERYNKEEEINSETNY